MIMQPPILCICLLVGIINVIAGVVGTDPTKVLSIKISDEKASSTRATGSEYFLDGNRTDTLPYGKLVNSTIWVSVVTLDYYFIQSELYFYTACASRSY